MYRRHEEYGTSYMEFSIPGISRASAECTGRFIGCGIAAVTGNFDEVSRRSTEVFDGRE